MLCSVLLVSAVQQSEPALRLHISPLFLDFLSIWVTIERCVWASKGHSGDESANAGDAGDARSVPGSGRSPGVGHGNPLQYSCLENHIEELGGLQSVGLQRVGHD